MDFFERYLGISPDGGDGSAEVLFLVVLVAIIAFLAWCLLRRPNIKDDAQAPFVRLGSHDANDETTHGVVHIGLIVTIVACATILGGYYLL